MNKIIHNYFYSFGYQLITMFLPFVIIPYITRVLGVGNLGIEAYTLSIVSIFIVLGNLGMNNYATRQVAMFRDDEEKLKAEVYSLLFIRSITSFIFLIFFCIYSLNTQHTALLFMQVVFFIAATFFDVIWYFTGKERFKEIVMRNLFIKIIGVLLIFVWVKNEDDLWIYILINGLVNIIPNIYFFSMVIKEIGKPKREYFRISIVKVQFLKLVPFGIMALIIQCYMNIDRIILEYYQLTYELGIYSQFLKVINTTLAPITAVGTILLPRMSYLSAKSNNGETEKILALSTNIIIVISVGIFFGLEAISNQFVPLFFGREFKDFVGLFQLGILLVFTGSMSNILVQQLIIPNKKEKAYTVFLFIATIIRVVLVLTLINNIGIYSVMIAFILSEIFIIACCMLVVKKNHSIYNLFPFINIIKIFICGGIMCILVYSIQKNLVVSVCIGVVTYTGGLILIKENFSNLLVGKLLKSYFKR